MNIELLYFDGCPTYTVAAELIDEVVHELDVDASVRHVRVDDDAQARELRFLGSPSVRVDGVDIDPGAPARTDFGRRCRLYPASEGFNGAPPRDWLVAALRGEEPVSASVAKPVEACPCCPSTLKPVTLLVAEWCPQCPSAEHHWKQLAARLDFVLELVDIATVEGRELANRHEVRAVPAVLIEDRVFAAGTTKPSAEAVVAVLGRDGA